jgi:hypothetical protein
MAWHDMSWHYLVRAHCVIICAATRLEGYCSRVQLARTVPLFFYSSVDQVGEFQCVCLTIPFAHQLVIAVSGHPFHFVCNVVVAPIAE